MSRTDTQRVGQDEVSAIRQSGVCAQPSTGQYRKTSSLLERLSVSRFPNRCPRLYRSLFEVRSFYNRIRLLWKRVRPGLGHPHGLETGPVWEEASPGCLVRNKRTQARSTDTQKLLADCPYLSLEDCRLFLLGWDAGEGWRRNLDSAESSCDKSIPTCGRF